MIYLDNAATSWPKPEAVIRATVGAMRSAGGNPGRSGHPLSLRAGRLTEACRRALGEYFRTEGDRFIFTNNCTMALNLAIKGMIRPGCHVITTCMEHNSVLRPLHALQAEKKIALTVLTPGTEGRFRPEDFACAATSQTALAVCTQASNLTGISQPVAQIARALAKKQVPLLVDGAQGAGHIPTNLEASGISLYAFPGHKGLLGPQGTGALWLKKGIYPSCLWEGGTGSDSHLLTQPQVLPDRYEAGTLNAPGLAGLWAGVTVLQREPEDLLPCVQDFYRGLSQMPVRILSKPDDLTCGIVSFAAEGADSVTLSQAVSDADICVRGGLHCAPLAHEFYGTLASGAVRVSFGRGNTREDGERCLEVLYDFLKSM